MGEGGVTMVKRGVSVVERGEGLGEVVGDCCGRQVARGHGGEAGGKDNVDELLRQKI